MRSFINAINVMNASDRQDCVTVAGMNELHSGSLRRLHLYDGRPVTTTPAKLAGSQPGRSPERVSAHGWQEHTGSARPCSPGRGARRCAARIA